jgi:hypothetical protein
LHAKIITASITSVSRALGQGNSYVSIITSAIFALVSFFYVYEVGSYFKIGVSILQDRVVYDTFFNFYVINKYLDPIVIASATAVWLALSFRGRLKFISTAIYVALTVILAIADYDMLFDIAALLSIPTMISLLIYNRFATKKILNACTKLSVNYLAIVLIITSLLSIAISSALILFSVSEPIPIRNYAYDIFLLLSSFSPVMIFLLVNCFPVKLLLNQFMDKISSKIKYSNRIASAPIISERIKWRTKIIYLSFFVTLSVVMVMIPHQPTINKDNQHIGADTGDYIHSIDILTKSPTITEFIRQAFFIQLGGDRPLTFIFLFTIFKILSAADISYVVDYIVPAILSPLLVLAVYFLSREMTSNDRTALLASFLTAVSFHTLVAIYGGFYANWFALIIGYLSFVFLIRFLRTSSKQSFVVYSLLILVLLFSHVYTWSLLAIVSGIFLIVMLKLNYYDKKRVILLLIVILSSVIVDVVRTTITHSHSGIERDMSIAHVEVGLKQFTQRWSNLAYAMHDYLGGLFGSFIILILGVYWLFRFDIKETSNILIVIFLSVGIVPLYFGDWVVQDRVFYNIPFQIPAAIGLTYLNKPNNGTIITLSVCIWLVAMSILAASNFYLVIPAS